MNEIKKILVVDDEESVTNLIRKVFEKFKYKVVMLNDAEKAVEAYQKELPDCVLLDLKMPNISGIEILSQIRVINNKAVVIMITGHGDLDNAMECMKHGAFDFITKPFDLEFIRTLVNHAIESSDKIIEK